MSKTRVLTGAALVPILLAIVWYLPPLVFALLAVGGAAVGQAELYTMARTRGARPLIVTGTFFGALVVFNFYRPLIPSAGGAVFLVSCAIIAVLTARLFARRHVEGAFEDVSFTLLGIVYVALLFGYQVAIHAGPPGKQWLLFLYLVIWASDTGAYYAGTSFGRHRLYEKISPKKSIEGLVGGTVASAGVAALCAKWLVDGAGTAEAVLLGVVLALVGTVGDLAESMLKRSVGVKDSGSIMPGHGGLLDRMDSMMFAAPVLYYYLRMR
ncbi:MAG: phosphatidate cytidylyltransferase [Nitrospiraceae bacterium]|nr:phosphatidate cytidylyltransferase [Nitrospiraceae bacterium]